MVNNNISIQEVARRLGISIDDAKILVKQGILHPEEQRGADNYFSSQDIVQIKSRQSPTLSEEAAQVGVQIQREVVTSVSGLQKILKRISFLSLTGTSFLTSLIIIIAILFEVYPADTSDFFGYYYRFNVSNTHARVLAAAIGPGEVAVRTSVLADVLKPIAATSLLAVKATDSQRYEQIVTNPSLGTNLPGPAGSQGSSGSSGPAGLSGLQGRVGPQGLSGPAGASGSNATNGISMTDVTKAIDESVSNLTNANLSSNAGITNDKLANSGVTIVPGQGLTGGGLVSLGGATSLNIGLTASGAAGLSSSNSGMEVSASGLTLLHGCGEGQLLKWSGTGSWRCAEDLTAADLQHVVSYDTSDEFTRITSSETTLATISVTHLTKTADIYLTGQAEVFSGSNDDQPFTLVIETGEKCGGPAVGNARLTYTITSRQSTTALRGVLLVSGVDLNPGDESVSYSLCASTAVGETDVQNWKLEALVIN